MLISFDHNVNIRDKEVEKFASRASTYLRSRLSADPDMKNILFVGISSGGSYWGEPLSRYFRSNYAKERGKRVYYLQTEKNDPSPIVVQKVAKKAAKCKADLVAFIDDGIYRKKTYQFMRPVITSLNDHGVPSLYLVKHDSTANFLKNKRGLADFSLIDGNGMTKEEACPPRYEFLNLVRTLYGRDFPYASRN